MLILPKFELRIFTAETQPKPSVEKKKSLKKILQRVIQTAVVLTLKSSAKPALCKDAHTAG